MKPKVDLQNNDNKMGVFPHSILKSSAHWYGSWPHNINLACTRDQKCKEKGEKSPVCYFLVQLLVFSIIFSSFITNTGLYFNNLNAQWLTTLSIRDTFSFPSPCSDWSCKDSFLVDYEANITESLTTAKVCYILLFLFRLFVFHTWFLSRMYCDDEHFSVTSE